MSLPHWNVLQHQTQPDVITDLAFSPSCDDAYVTCSGQGHLGIHHFGQGEKLTKKGPPIQWMLGIENK